MRHQGVAFPPLYEPAVREIRIKNRIVKLEPLQEEMLMAWAKKLGTPYVQDSVFQQNFMASLRENSKGMPFDFADVSLDEIDFSELQARAQEEKLSAMPEDKRKRESARRKKERAALKEKYGTAEVDDAEVEIAAYLVEPPGIFMGRGAHPLRGRWKPRVYPEDVELNLDEEAPIPEPSYPGRQWKGIVHEHDGLWVARWRDELADKIKYVWLSETSHLRQEREREKYEKAAQLAHKLPRVREYIRKGMRDRDERRRRVATVAYLIDALAMRVGDEKDEDEADTVGASTLRVEHIQLRENEIEFDFLGKDSVRWEKTLPIGEDETRRLLKENLTRLLENKGPEEQIFHDISSADVNRFLRKAVTGLPLTAKVFRTYHATTTVEDYLGQHMELSGETEAEREAEASYYARMANLQAAIKVNHKRTPPKNWEENLAKREEAVQRLRENPPDFGKLEAQVRARKKALELLRKEQAEFLAHAPEQAAAKAAELERLKPEPEPEGEKEKAALLKARDVASKALSKLEEANQSKAARFAERIRKAEEAVDKARASVTRARESYAARLKKAEYDLDLARQTRDYNLNTSLKNYIDPRKYQKWYGRFGYDWQTLYTTALRRKFAWVKSRSRARRRTDGRGAPAAASAEEASSHNGSEGAQPEPEMQNAGR